MQPTLLDPLVAPALELVYAYHERWEIEILIDEVQTHQRLNGKPLRSQKPAGVLQDKDSPNVVKIQLGSFKGEMTLPVEKPIDLTERRPS